MSDGPTKLRRVRPGRAPPADASPSLEVLRGADLGRLHWLATGTTIIGRTPESDVRLLDDGVSRQHAKLLVNDDGLVNLVDLESTNGTFLNAAPIDAAIVRDGDRIQLGPEVILGFAYRVRRPGVEAPPPVELSAREMQIARLVADGKTNAAIGRELHISAHTVTSHLSNVYARLGLRSRAELARLVATGGVRGPATMDE
jgi:DNA-binding CsgD family transcriptional regulator